MRDKIMPPCDIHNPHPRLEALGHNPRFHFIGPAAVPTPTRFNDFAAANKSITTICHTHPQNNCALHLADASNVRNIPVQWGMDGAYGVAEFAKELADGVGVRPNARCVKQGCAQLGHRDVTILRDDFGEEGPMRVQLALAFRPTLRSSLRPTCPPDRKRPSRSRGGRQLQAQCRRATA
jgi:hypothetical protein